jgi:rhodanese-related sulfurtransferase
VGDAGKSVRLLALALIAAAAFAASWMAAPAQTGAQAGAMHNCPTSGKWSIAVWDGADGTTATDALATCGAGAVDAAYALDPQTGAFLPAPALRAKFAAVGAFDKKRVITYCGGGIAASADSLILVMLGHPDVRLYDGSMAEWTQLAPAVAYPVQRTAR